MSQPEGPGFGDNHTQRDQQTTLLEMTLVLAALPTVLPHWWIYYNVVLILPLMACLAAGWKAPKKNDVVR